MPTYDLDETIVQTKNIVMNDSELIQIMTDEILTKRKSIKSNQLSLTKSPAKEDTQLIYERNFIEMQLEAIINDSRTGIDSHLVKYDSRLKMRNKNETWQYNMMKLKKYIANSIYFRSAEEPSFWQMLNKTSFSGMYSWGNTFSASDAKFFDSLEENIKIGLRHQDKNNDPSFCTNVCDKGKSFLNRMHRLANSMRSLYSLKNSKFFSEKYQESVINKLEVVAVELENREKADASVFEIFFQIVHSQRLIGISRSQKYVSKYFFNHIMDKPIIPIPYCATKKYEAYADITTTKDAGKYIKENVDDLIDVIFAGTDLSLEDRKKLLRNNYDNITLVYNFADLETKNNRHGKRGTKNIEKRVQVIIALCRAMLVPEFYCRTNTGENLYRPLIKQTFSADGYTMGGSNKKKILILHDAKAYANNTQIDGNNQNEYESIHEFSSRLALEIINMYISLYNNKHEYFRRRMIIEQKFDEFAERVLKLHDYTIYEYFNNNYYSQLEDVVLPSEFIEFLVESYINEWFSTNYHVKLTPDTVKYYRTSILNTYNEITEAPLELFEENLYVMLKSNLCSLPPSGTGDVIL